MVPLVFALLGFCISVVSFFYFRWYIRRETAVTQQVEVYRKEIDGLIAAIDTITDRDSLLVEERIKILKKLLDDTDKRIAVYVKEMQRGRSSEVLYDSLGRNTLAPAEYRPPPQEHPSLFQAEPVSSGTPPSEAIAAETEPLGETAMPAAAGNENAAAEVPPGKKQRKSRRTQAQTADVSTASAGMDADATEKAPQAANAPSVKSKLKVQIAEMSANGIPSQEIASELGISIAEVDLALNLLNRPTG